MSTPTPTAQTLNLTKAHAVRKQQDEFLNMLADARISNEEIFATLGISPQMVVKWLRSKRFVKQFSTLRKRLTRVCAMDIARAKAACAAFVHELASKGPDALASVAALLKDLLVAIETTTPPPAETQRAPRKDKTPKRLNVQNAALQRLEKTRG